jgi:hypothetical protein
VSTPSDESTPSPLVDCPVSEAAEPLPAADAYDAELVNRFEVGPEVVVPLADDPVGAMEQAGLIGPQRKYFRCPKGHEQNDTEEFSFRLSNAFTGQAMYDSGPLCYRCIFEHANAGGARQYDEGGPEWYGAVFQFLTENFQTRRIAAPEPEEVTPEQMAAMVAAADLAEMTGAAPDFIGHNGVEHYKCAGPRCTVFISGEGPDLPRFCPSCEPYHFEAGPTEVIIPLEPGPPGPTGPPMVVTNVDQDAGTVTFEAVDDADHPAGS